MALPFGFEVSGFEMSGFKSGGCGVPAGAVSFRDAPKNGFPRGVPLAPKGRNGGRTSPCRASRDKSMRGTS